MDLDTYYNTKPGISLLLRPFLVLIEDQPSRIIKTKLGLNRRPKKGQERVCFTIPILHCPDRVEVSVSWILFLKFVYKNNYELQTTNGVLFIK